MWLLCSSTSQRKKLWKKHWMSCRIIVLLQNRKSSTCCVSLRIVPWQRCWIHSQPWFFSPLFLLFALWIQVGTSVSSITNVIVAHLGDAAVLGLVDVSHRSWNSCLWKDYFFFLCKRVLLSGSLICCLRPWTFLLTDGKIVFYSSWIFVVDPFCLKEAACSVPGVLCK